MAEPGQQAECPIFAVGDRVVVTRPNAVEKGTVKYFGTTQFHPGSWLGIRLDSPTGKHGGTVQGVCYFECTPLHGVFSQPQQCTILEEPPPSPLLPPPPQAPATKPRAKPAEFTASATATVGSDSEAQDGPASPPCQDKRSGIDSAEEKTPPCPAEAPVAKPPTPLRRQASFTDVPLSAKLALTSLAITEKPSCAIFTLGGQDALLEAQAEGAELACKSALQGILETAFKGDLDSFTEACHRFLSSRNASLNSIAGALHPQPAALSLCAFRAPLLAIERVKQLLSEHEASKTHFSSKVALGTPDQADTNKHRLFLHVVEGHKLPPALSYVCRIHVLSMDAALDEGGGYRHEFSTRRIEKTACPAWNEHFTCDFNNVDREVLLLEVRDGHSNAVLGRSYIPLLGLFQEKMQMLSPQGLHKWFALFNDGFSDRVTGTIALRFLFSKDGQAPPALKTLLPVLPPADFISVFLTTWNMGDSPPPEDLSLWLPVGSHDLYVIGVQECNYSAREGAQNCKEDWRNTLVRHMGRQYRLVSFHNLWEIRVAVFVRNRYRLSIGPVLYHKEATGIGNVLGNKGAVVLSLDFNHTSMCFVVCHLAAHQGEITRRNQSARSIFRNAKACYPCSWARKHVDITSAHDAVFVLGDLNYRLDYEEQEKRPSEEIFWKMATKIEVGSEGRAELFATDQLGKEMRKGAVFHGFSEGSAVHGCTAFRPTFKVHRHIRPVTYNMGRSPAWTDRVLVKAFPTFALLATAYDSCENVLTSDHKPVVATFNCRVNALPCAIATAHKQCTVAVTGLQCKDLVEVAARQLENSKRKKGLGAAFHSVKASIRSKRKKKQVEGELFGAFLEVSSPMLEARLATELSAAEHRWAGTRPATTPLSCNNPYRMQREVLWLQAFDYSDSLIGQTAVPLLSPSEQGPGALGANYTAVHHFDVELSYAGKYAGVAQGTILVSWGEGHVQAQIDGRQLPALAQGGEAQEVEEGVEL